MYSSASANRNLEQTFHSSQRSIAQQVSSQTTRDVWQKLQRAICTLKRRAGAIAPAALCVAASEVQLAPLIITTHFPHTSTNNLDNAVLNFPALKANTGISINLPRNSVLDIWDDQRINFTVIWLSNDVADECRNKGANFLKIGTPAVNEEV